MNYLLRALCALLLAFGTAFAQVTAFLPTGPTVNIAVSGTAQNLVLPTATSTGLTANQVATLSQNVVLTNVGTQTVFFRVGATATVSNAMPLLPNSQVVISVPSSGATASVIAATTGSTLYATVGYGK